jgi:hypothetical protein
LHKECLVSMNLLFCYRIRDSSVGTATGYRLEAGVLFPTEERCFSLLHLVQTGFGAHPASYIVGTGGSYPRGKVARP